jgi:hypothetical protein
MIDRQKNFLIATLGPDGFNALEKAASRSELLGQALLPRSVFAWVNGVGEFDGIIPGTDDVVLRFAKSEKGFTGCVDLHKFEDASLIHVSAALAVALGVDKLYGEEARSLDLENLGKSLDLLVKNRLEKAEKKICGKKVDGRVCELKPNHEPASCIGAEVDDHDSDLVKAGMTPQVKNAAPEAPSAPTAPIASGQSPATKPVAPAPAVAKAPKLPKPAGATVALARSEMNHLCPACASPQFTGDELNPCICFSELKKSIEILHLDELGCVVHIAEPMPEVVTFLEAMGRE